MASSRIYNGLTGNRYEFRVAGYRVGFLLMTFAAVVAIGSLALGNVIGLWALVPFILGMALFMWLVKLSDTAAPDGILPEWVVVATVIRGLWTRTWRN